MRHSRRGVAHFHVTWNTSTMHGWFSYACMKRFGKEGTDMRYAVTGQEMKEYDRKTISEIGIPSLVLMERAALETVRVLLNEKKDPRTALILAGTGNNGGDGLAVGRMLADRGIQVTFLLAGNQEKLSREAALQRDILLNLGFSIQSKLENQEYDIIVDALFGVGLSRDIEGEYFELISQVNRMHQAGSFLCSVDIPSGVCADTGKVMGCAVKADLTVAFAFAKRGELLYPGKEYTGKLIICDIGIPENLANEQKPEAFFYEKEDAIRKLPVRIPWGNKGTFGKVLLIAGNYDMCGACILAGNSIFRTGAGMVKILTPECNREILQSTLPEAMLYSYQDVPEEEQVRKSLEWADVIVAGPGIGTGRAAYLLVRQCLEECSLPIVLDADALNLIGSNRDLAELLRHRDKKNVVLTPHPGELVRLLGTDMRHYQKDRMALIRKALEEYGCVLAAKDAVTIAAGTGENELYINTSGNDGMAVAGSGDVLAGMIGALIAQKVPCFEAAALGIFLHGLAGDGAYERKGRYAMTAKDIIDQLPQVMGADISTMGSGEK